ncbi:hypothetical protein vseg_015883 [Gypsophila vaccaria]
MERVDETEDVTSGHPILTQRRPSFFRYFCPNHSFTKLSVPVEFFQKYNIKLEVTLKTIWGPKEWKVKAKRVGDMVRLTQGWRTYVKDNSLEGGEFLIFKYVDKSCFYVVIHGEDGCVREQSFEESSVGTSESPLMDRHSPADASIEEVPFVGLESEDEDDVHNEHGLRFSKTFRTTFKNYVIVPMVIFDQCVMKLPQSIILRSDKGVEMMTQLRRTSDRVVMGYVGIHKFWKDNDVKIGDTLEFEVILGDGRIVEEVIMRNTTRLMQSKVPIEESSFGGRRDS